MIARRVVMAGMATACLARPLGLRAQPRARPARVGLLGNTRGGGCTGAPDLLPVFTAALREQGWVEGKNISFEARWAEHQLDRYP